MENLAYKEKEEVYAVINRLDQVVGIFSDYNDAVRVAEKYNALCIEALEDFDGSVGTVADTVMTSEITKKDMMKQKIYALVLILLSIIMIPLMNGDATFALFMVPCMVYLFFSKKYWIID